MMLVMVLTGISVGSATVSRFVKRVQNLEIHLVGAFLGMALWTGVAMEGILLISEWSVRQTGLQSIDQFLLRQVGTGALLFPLAFLSGALFPLATRLLDPRARDADATQVARVCAWNTLGALLGALAAGFAIAPRFEFFHALDLLAAANAVVAAALAAVFIALAATGRRLRYTLAAIGITALALAGWGLQRVRSESPLVAEFHHRYPDMEMISHRPGLQGVTSVIRDRGEELADHLFVNGLGMTVKLTDTKMMAHLPLLLHEQPDETLVICFGMGTTYRSALAHGGRVTAVELVREVADAFPLFFADAEQIRRNPRGRILINDGRNFLTLSRGLFDVITIDPPPPIDAAFVSQLYSREFVELARSRLKPDGIFAHWIPFPGTKAGVDDAETFQMLLATVTDVFAHVWVIPSYQQVGLHVLASSQPLQLDPERIASRLADPMISADLQEWDAVPSAYFAELQPAPLVTGTLGLLTDDRPRIEFYLLRSWTRGIEKPRMSLW
jgi:spermidine synthase